MIGSNRRTPTLMDPPISMSGRPSTTATKKKKEASLPSLVTSSLRHRGGAALISGSSGEEDIFFWMTFKSHHTLGRDDYNQNRDSSTLIRFRKEGDATKKMSVSTIFFFLSHFTMSTTTPTSEEKQEKQFSSV